jgi:catechol 2,3-dioxygenase-like lactoylglutathione lyase family enzyme
MGHKAVTYLPDNTDTEARTTAMNLGWCDVCMAVADAVKSRMFYEVLGFRVVEGSDSDGWAVVTNGDVRLGLYEQRHMGSDRVSLNFRGGDVQSNAEDLVRRGLIVETGPTAGRGGGWSATLRYPDGYLIFLDTAPGETRKDIK